jgi:hypothetical protein
VYLKFGKTHVAGFRYFKRKPLSKYQSSPNLNSEYSPRNDEVSELEINHNGMPFNFRLLEDKS